MKNSDEARLASLDRAVKFMRFNDPAPSTREFIEAGDIFNAYVSVNDNTVRRGWQDRLSCLDQAISSIPKDILYPPSPEDVVSRAQKFEAFVIRPATSTAADKD